MTPAPTHHAQATKPEAVTIAELESLQLTRNLLRIAVFNICYIRGLFPDEYFEDKNVPALEMKVKKLMPTDMESKRLIEWMEKGVYDALQKKYLRTLLFGICDADDGPLVEEYNFSFSYTNSCESAVFMSIDHSSHNSTGKNVLKTKSTDHLTPQEMKNSACKMVRTLVQLMHTLDSVPEERTIIMKLYYYDDVTPADYEPPLFVPSTYEEYSKWSRVPLKMEVGKVNSRHYSVSLKMKSILDPCKDENEGQVKNSGSDTSDTTDSDSESDSEGSDVNTFLIPRSTCNPAAKDKVSDVIAPAAVEPPADALATELRKLQAMDEDTPDSQVNSSQSLASVREWIRTGDHDKIDMFCILGNFPEISLVRIEEHVKCLVEEGLLKVVERDLFQINKEKAGQEQTNGWVETRPSNETAPCAKKDPQGISNSFPNGLEQVKDVLQREADQDNNYRKALLFTLSKDYVTIAQLHNEMKGAVSMVIVRKYLDRMAKDGYIEGTAKNRRLGRRVLHTSEAKKKLQELQPTLETKTQVQKPTEEPELAFGQSNLHPQRSPAVNAKSETNKQGNAVIDCINTHGSTYGRVQNIGSEVTRPEHDRSIQSTTVQPGFSGLLKKPPLPRQARQELCQPTETGESAIPLPLCGPGVTEAELRGNQVSIPVEVIMNCSQTTIDTSHPEHRRCRKASKVDKPLHQPPLKRSRS